MNPTGNRANSAADINLAAIRTLQEFLTTTSDLTLGRRHDPDRGAPPSDLYSKEDRAGAAALYRPSFDARAIQASRSASLE
jgi:hypothetical protein